MPHDSGEDLGVFFEVVRDQRVEMTSLRVLDACAQTIEDLDPRFFLTDPDRLIGGIEIVVCRIPGIQLHQRENEMGVDDALSAGPEGPVVGAGQLEVHLAEFGIVFPE